MITTWQLVHGVANREPPDDVMTDEVAADTADEAVSIVRVARGIMPAHVQFMTVRPRPPLLAFMEPDRRQSAADHEAGQLALGDVCAP